MDRLEEMKIFVEVVRQKSLTAAASSLHISVSKASQAVARLENRVKVQLAVRTTRSIQITREGQAYFEYCTELLESVERKTNEIRDIAAACSGMIRVDSPAILTRRMFIPAMHGFLEQFPEVSFEFINSEHIIDLEHLACDLMVRVGPFKDSSFVGVSLGHSECIAAAAPSYLKKYGEPETPGDLVDHNCIQFVDPHSGRIAPWSFWQKKQKATVRTTGNVFFNEAGCAFSAATDGLGIIYSTEVMIADLLEAGSLRRVLPDWRGTDHHVILAYPKTDYLPFRVRAFVDCMKSLYPPGSSLDSL